jgi:tRNA-dihydrouridine synthase 3
MLKNFVNYGLEHWGSDDQGVRTTRRFLLEWLSYLHRYCPFALLEKPPQKINIRPNLYVRDQFIHLLRNFICIL